MKDKKKADESSDQSLENKESELDEFLDDEFEEEIN
jgi:hypothetical protein